METSPKNKHAKGNAKSGIDVFFYPSQFKKKRKNKKHKSNK